MNVKNEELENNKVIQLDDNHWQTYTSIIIDAPLAQVWETITNWDEIGNWSSSLKSIEGDRVNGGDVIVSYSVNGNIYETAHKFIYVDQQEFGWSDPMTGIFEGLTDNHRFRVEELSDNRTLFIQKDDFKGEGNEKISPKMVANQTISFFPVFNRELKSKVENK